jgi:ubiquitin carboxyl-terminal hydrolase 22
MDLNWGAIYCYACQDYVFDSELEMIAKKLRHKSIQFLGQSCGSYYQWEPSLNELQILKQNPQRKRISENSYIGLKHLLTNTGDISCYYLTFLFVHVQVFEG